MIKATARVGVQYEGTPNVKTNRVYAVKSFDDDDPDAPGQLIAITPNIANTNAEPSARIGRPPKYRPAKPPKPRKYYKDPTAAGRDYRQVCISFYDEDLAIVDEEAKRLRMSRSDLLRKAALEFVAANRNR